MCYGKTRNGGEIMKRATALVTVIIMALSLHTTAFAKSSVIFSENYNDPDYALNWEMVNGKSYKVMASRYFRGNPSFCVHIYFTPFRVQEYVRTPECEKKSVNLIPSMIEYK